MTSATYIGKGTGGEESTRLTRLVQCARCAFLAKFCGLGRCRQIRVREHIEALDVSPMIGMVGIYYTDGLSSGRLFRVA